MAQFLNAADSTNRNYSHPYANYILIKNLSEMLMDSEYETDYNKWKQVSVIEINDAASSLYKISEDTLNENNELTEVI